MLFNAIFPRVCLNLQGIVLLCNAESLISQSAAHTYAAPHHKCSVLHSQGSCFINGLNVARLLVQFCPEFYCGSFVQLLCLFLSSLQCLDS